jgi:predicted Fe-Mo cluster-binding NifX family protein
MRIAVTASQASCDSPVDSRFARARLFLVHDDSSGTWEGVENSQALDAPQGAGIQAAETLANRQIDVVLTGHCGPKAFRAFLAAGITVCTGVTGTVEQAVKDFKAGKLTPATCSDVEGHW